MMISPAMGSKPTSWWGFHPKKHPETRCLWLSQRDQDVWLEIPPAKDTFGRILHQLVDGKHPTYSLWWFIPYSISYHLSYHLFPTGAGFRNHRSWPWGITHPATTFTFPIINSSCHFTWQELAPLLVPLHHGAEKIKATFQDFGVCIATGLASFGDNVGDLGRYWGDIVAIYDGV
jgi:hypothetical protein